MERKINKQLMPEKQCPECKGKIDWKVIRGKFGNSVYNGLCKKCNIILRGRETPDITKGKNLAKTLKIKNCMDKRLTQHNADVQIGFLRTTMHCAKCGLPNYAGKYCKCKKCKCIYCQDYK